MERFINTTHFGDCMSILPKLIESGMKIQMCVMSIPYWGLRKYLEPGHPMEAYEIGCELSLDEYLQRIVEVFRLVRDVLSDDGTLWLNVGDAYTSGNRGPERFDSKYQGRTIDYRHPTPEGLKPKDLIGLPWRVAFALQADGWWLRSEIISEQHWICPSCGEELIIVRENYDRDIIWHKPNPMPESVKDRPTRNHEYIFLLSKQQHYYYNADAIKEPAKYPNGPNSPHSIKSPHGQGFSRINKPTRNHEQIFLFSKQDHYYYDIDAIKEPVSDTAHSRGSGINPKSLQAQKGTRQNPSFSGAIKELVDKRNKRTVWHIATIPYKGAHFATFPPDLIKPCVLAGSRPGDIVLDPFGGSGTTAQVAQDFGRKWILIEINEDYKSLIAERTAQQSLEI